MLLLVKKMNLIQQEVNFLMRKRTPFACFICGYILFFSMVVWYQIMIERNNSIVINVPKYFKAKLARKSVLLHFVKKRNHSIFESEFNYHHKIHTHIASNPHLNGFFSFMNQRYMFINMNNEYAYVKEELSISNVTYEIQNSFKKDLKEHISSIHNENKELSCKFCNNNLEC